jgi:hypothetical protein
MHMFYGQEEQYHNTSSAADNSPERQPIITQQEKYAADCGKGNHRRGNDFGITLFLNLLVDETEYWLIGQRVRHNNSDPSGIVSGGP